MNCITGCIEQLQSNAKIVTFNMNQKFLSKELSNGYWHGDCKYKISVLRYGDILEPIKIQCYNCDNFKIKSIIFCTLSSRESVIDVDFFKFENIEEEIRIDNKLCKVYHLDKLKFTPILLFPMKHYQNYDIYIETEGECDNIVLNSRYSLFQTNFRDKYYSINDGHFSVDVLRFKSSDEFVCKSNTLYGISCGWGTYINGLIVTGFDNIQNINRLQIKLSSRYRNHYHKYISYDDKLTIMENTINIDDHTIYISFNGKSYKDKVDVKSALNTRSGMIFLFSMDDDVSQKLKIGFYELGELNVAPNCYVVYYNSSVIGVHEERM